MDAYYLIIYYLTYCKHFYNSESSNMREITQHEHKSFRNFTSLKIRAHVKPRAKNGVYHKSFTSLKIGAHVKPIVIKAVFPYSFTPLKIRAHVKRINTITPTFLLLHL